VQFVIDALAFVFSLLLDGLFYAFGRRIFLHNDVHPSSKCEFERRQPFLVTDIDQLCEANAAFHKVAMTERACASLDGSWHHRMNGSLCAIAMTDACTNKIGDWRICEQQEQNVKGNTDAIPGNMWLLNRDQSFTPHEARRANNSTWGASAASGARSGSAMQRATASRFAGPDIHCKSAYDPCLWHRFGIDRLRNKSSIPRAAARFAFGQRLHSRP
jgi:hypothetical protein